MPKQRFFQESHQIQGLQENSDNSNLSDLESLHTKARQILSNMFNKKPGLLNELKSLSNEKIDALVSSDMSMLKKHPEILSDILMEHPESLSALFEKHPDLLLDIAKEESSETLNEFISLLKDNSDILNEIISSGNSARGMKP